ncbi:hypothetical protein FZC35_01705 [Candidatus Cytomitobacter indipagum]|uniref:Outer membrane protein beta-barrel domain-containing protein n=1 Tax=Candidatus Cytomitobacter indipagum TaxID=2601575 RepID=A0A5C0UDH3_9PROT|nr:hypothetical protein [Candidatus Cytomitobacter indipagum]QEK38085.1 hypothetical protein FZC35_01705 [Candidatus Cytomitobacter indipagum]
MNKKLLFATLISLSNQAFAGSFAGSFGFGATAQKTTLEAGIKNTIFAFKEDGNKGYFAGKALVSLGMKKGSSFFGVKLSASLMSDKKNLINHNANEKFINSKSNFAAHVGPEFGYQINNKFSVCYAILLAYKNMKIKNKEIKIKKEYQCGFGATVAAFYNITKIFQIGLEHGVDFMMKKENAFDNQSDKKVKEEASVKSNFTPHASVIAKISFGK